MDFKKGTEFRSLFLFACSLSAWGISAILEDPWYLHLSFITLHQGISAVARVLFFTDRALLSPCSARNALIPRNVLLLCSRMFRIIHQPFPLWMYYASLPERSWTNAEICLSENHWMVEIWLHLRQWRTSIPLICSKTMIAKPTTPCSHTKFFIFQSTDSWEIVWLWNKINYGDLPAYFLYWPSESHVHWIKRTKAMICLRSHGSGRVPVARYIDQNSSSARKRSPWSDPRYRFSYCGFWWRQSRRHWTYPASIFGYTQKERGRHGLTLRVGRLCTARSNHRRPVKSQKESCSRKTGHRENNACCAKLPNPGKNSRVVIVDTSNENGGDGESPSGQLEEPDASSMQSLQTARSDESRQ